VTAIRMDPAAQFNSASPAAKTVPFFDGGISWLLLILLGLALPVIFFGTRETIYAHDQAEYHLPAIRQIHASWPRLDLARDTLSAVAPGYHYVLATVALVIGPGEAGLRIVNMLVGFAAVYLLYRFARNRFPPARAFVLLLPFVLSNFVIKSAAWIVTDNAGLATAILTLLLLFDGRLSNPFDPRPGLAAAIATMVRQLNVWLMAPVLLRMFLTAASVPEKGQARPKGASAFIGLAAALSPAVVIAFLFRAWHGLVPPAWRDTSLSFSLCPLSYLLSVFGLLGFFYLGALRTGLGWSRPKDPLILALAALGFAAASLSPTSYSPDQGRWGGYFWGAASVLPTVANRSLLFLTLAPLGGAMLGWFFRAIERGSGRQSARLWLAATASWAATFLVNRQVFHRYYEPIILVFLVIGATLAAPGERESTARFAARLSLLSLAQLGLTLLGISEAFGFGWLAGYRR
jgi:hypothetical protein